MVGQRKRDVLQVVRFANEWRYDVGIDVANEEVVAKDVDRLYDASLDFEASFEFAYALDSHFVYLGVARVAAHDKLLG